MTVGIDPRPIGSADVVPMTNAVVDRRVDFGVERCEVEVAEPTEVEAILQARDRLRDLVVELGRVDQRIDELKASIGKRTGELLRYREQRRLALVADEPLPDAPQVLGEQQLDEERLEALKEKRADLLAKVEGARAHHRGLCVRRVLALRADAAAEYAGASRALKAAWLRLQGLEHLCQSSGAKPLVDHGTLMGAKLPALLPYLPAEVGDGMTYFLAMNESQLGTPIRASGKLRQEIELELGGERLPW